MSDDNVIEVGAGTHDLGLVCEHCGQFEIVVEIKAERPVNLHYSGEYHHLCSHCKEMTPFQHKDLMRNH